MFNELNSMLKDESAAIEKVELTADDDALLFLTALEAESTPEEFRAILEQQGPELMLRGLLPSSSAMEAGTKRVVITIDKKTTFDRVQKRACIRLAAANNDQLYDKYKFHRIKMIEYRLAMYDKYGSRARAAAKKSLQGSRDKSSTMKNSNSITDKIDNQLKKIGQ